MTKPQATAPRCSAPNMKASCRDAPRRRNMLLVGSCGTVFPRSADNPDTLIPRPAFRERLSAAPDAAPGACRGRQRPAYWKLCAAQVGTRVNPDGDPTTCLSQPERTKTCCRISPDRLAPGTPGPKGRTGRSPPARPLGGRSAVHRGPSLPVTGIGNATADARIFDAPALPRARGRCRFLTCEATGKPSNLAARRRFLHETVDRRSH